MSGFFTRPDLDDRQFRQLAGSILTLSGETNFAGILKSKGVEIDASTGTSSIGDVLTWDGSKIVLSPSSGGGGSIYYTGATPSNIEVGGMTVGTVLTGRTFSDILEEILITTLNPTIVPPNNTFVEDISPNTQEVGTLFPTINFTSTFSQGTITPQYDATGTEIAPSAPRSGVVNAYTYTGAQIAGTYPSVVSPDNRVATNYVLLVGANTWTATASYDASVIVAYDSAGGVFSPALPAGTTSPAKSVTLTGIYPYFYGKVPSANPRPVAGQALLNSGTKVVASSTGTVNVTYNTTGAEWTWVAIPTTSALKTKWYVTALSNGTIGGVYPSGNKYPNPDTVSVNSPTALWSGINYRFYISENAGIETNIEFRNS